MKQGEVNFAGQKEKTLDGEIMPDTFKLESQCLHQSLNKHNTWKLGGYNNFFWEYGKINENKRVAGALLTDLTQS